MRRTTKRKPVILLKGGRTTAGTKAVASHTASLAGSQAVWEAMCRQSGAISVTSMDQLVDLLVAFRFLRPAQGFQVGVGGGGGGLGVRSADECEEAGLRVIPLPSDLQEQLKARDPVYWDWVSNPVDGSILGVGPLKVDEVMKLMADHQDFDVLIGNLDVKFSLDRPEAISRTKESLEALIRVGQQTSKPLAIAMSDELPPMEWKQQAILEMRELCIQAGMAVFPTIARAAQAIRRFVEYHRWLLELAEEREQQSFQAIGGEPPSRA